MRGWLFSTWAVAVGDVLPENICWISRRAAASIINRAGESVGRVGEFEALGLRPTKDRTLVTTLDTKVGGVVGWFFSEVATAVSTERTSVVGEAPATWTVAPLVERNGAPDATAPVSTVLDDVLGGTRVLTLVHDLHIRTINAATGD